MTRLGMVFLGLIATAAAIAVGVAVVTESPQETRPLPLTPAQMAELRPADDAQKVRPPPAPRHDDAGLDVTPEDGDGEDGPGS